MRTSCLLLILTMTLTILPAFGQSTPLEYFEAWKAKGYDLNKMKPEEILKLEPSPVKDPAFKDKVKKTVMEVIEKKYQADNCKLEEVGANYVFKCSGQEDRDATDTVKEALSSPTLIVLGMRSYYREGKSEKNRQEPVSPGTPVDTAKTLPPVVTQTPPPAAPPAAPVVAHVETKADSAQAVSPQSKRSFTAPPKPGPHKGTEPKPDEALKAEKTETKKPEAKAQEKLSCKDDFKAQLKKLLEDDSKNIIGQQFELTTLKVAALVVGNKQKTLEAFIKSQSDQIKAEDTGVMDKVKELYKKYGVEKDQETLTIELNSLKEKSKTASYYKKQNRFFNEESSAFLQGYRVVNKSSNLDDSDISVLWMMNQVSEKAREGGDFTQTHNLTNLSTRLANYTGAIDPKVKFSVEELKGMMEKQKESLKGEYQVVIEDFKKSNPACYAELFKDAGCEVTVVDETLSDLLTINSKIGSKDLINIDGQLKGSINSSYFSLQSFSKIR